MNDSCISRAFGRTWRTSTWVPRGGRRRAAPGPRLRGTRRRGRSHILCLQVQGGLDRRGGETVRSFWPRPRRRISVCSSCCQQTWLCVGVGWLICRGRCCPALPRKERRGRLGRALNSTMPPAPAPSRRPAPPGAARVLLQRLDRASMNIERFIYAEG